MSFEEILRSKGVDVFNFDWTSKESFVESAVWSKLEIKWSHAREVEYICLGALEASSLLATSKILCELEGPRESGRRELASVMACFLISKRLLDAKAEAYCSHIRDYLDLMCPRVWIPPKDSKVAKLKRSSEWLCERIVQNAFFERGERDALRLVGLGALFNHSCVPNVTYRYLAPIKTYEFYTLRHIAAGELLRFSYIPFPIDDLQARAENLKFTCNCQACIEQLVPSQYLAEHGIAADRGHCWHCGANAPHKCRACSARYCSAACQKANWQLVHRRICARLIN